MDFENVYSTLAEMLRERNFVIRTCAALKIEFAP